MLKDISRIITLKAVFTFEMICNISRDNKYQIIFLGIKWYLNDIMVHMILKQDFLP